MRDATLLPRRPTRLFLRLCMKEASNDLFAVRGAFFSRFYAFSYLYSVSRAFRGLALNFTPERILAQKKKISILAK